MSFLNHVRACNVHDLSGFRPFHMAGARVGWVRHTLAERLAGFGALFEVTADRVTLAQHFDNVDSRSAALADAVGRLVADGTIPPLRGEAYSVLTRWGAPPLARLDRVAVPWFGIDAYGLHVNGFVRHPGGDIDLWVGRRALDRGVAPGKLDNLIAGGQPHGLSLTENLIKEAGEEAGMDADLARRAVPVGAISYLLETTAGLKPDTLFLYDLELDPGFVPRNADGEVESFRLWPVDRVAAVVRDTDDFKFNCNLVIIDFLIRHGRLTPDDPDYLDLVKGLRR